MADKIKQGMNVEFVGKIYSVKAVNGGYIFGIQVSKKEEETWYGKFINCYAKTDTILTDRDLVKFSGFMTIDPPFKERKEELKIIAMGVTVLESNGQAATTVDHTQSKPASAPKVANRGF